MKKILLLFLILSTVSLGATKFNYMSGQHERYKPGQELRYNVQSEKWEFAYLNEENKYNYLDGKHEYADEGQILRYNYMNKKHEYADPEAELQYNALEGEWHYEN